MKSSIKFEDLVLKQLESFGCFMGVRHLVVYLASAKEGANAGFELIGQWPQIDRSLLPIDDDPELKFASANRRWYPLQDEDILIGVLRVETDYKDSEWPLILDSRLKALASSLAKTFSIEIERQNNNKEINYLRNQVGVIVHQLRNPLAALRTYAKLLIKRLGSDSDALDIVESMLNEQKQINEYVNSFDQLNKTIKIKGGISDERLLLPPNLKSNKTINLQSLLLPIFERGKASAKLQNKLWCQNIEWPDWILEQVPSKYGVIAEIVANLLENAFKYSNKNSEVGVKFIKFGILIFDTGKVISKEEKVNIFKKGFRGDASKDKEGSGVGLYVARQLATQIGGDLILYEQNNNGDLDSYFEDTSKVNIFYLKFPNEILHV